MSGTLISRSILMGQSFTPRLIIAILLSILFTAEVSYAANLMCSQLFEERRDTEASSYDVAEVVKGYIFQGPILNFYLRYRDDSSRSMIAESLFKANDLDAKKANEMIQNIDSVLRSYPDRNENIVVYRGESRPNEGTLKVGTQMHYKNFVSATREIELAKVYATGNAKPSDLKILYKIEVGPDVPGLQINELAPEGIRNQDEFLLARDGVLTVTDIQTEGDLTVVSAVYTFGAN